MNPSPGNDNPRAEESASAGGLSRSACRWIGGGILLGVLAYGTLAFYITSTDSETNFLQDGFGRRLRETPSVVRLFFGKERVWAGWYWFALDTVVMVGGLISGALLFNRGDSKPRSETEFTDQT